MKRTSTAKWMENQKRWQINVQKDGVRRSFTSSTPGRTGQRKANAKADAWLDDNIDNTNIRVSALLDEYLKNVESTTSISNYRKEKYHVESFIRPEIGQKKIVSITEQHFQNIINKAFRKKDEKTGEITERSKKTLSNIRATIMAFLKFCRKKKVTNLVLEDLTIPQGARLKGTQILQPADLLTLFKCDTTIMYGERVFDKFIYAYRFCVLTGLRPGEARGLTRDSINDNQIRIERSINSYNMETKGKNDNAIRSFHMSEIAKRTLDAQLELNPDGEYIFDIPSTTTFLHRWTRYCESNNIAHISLYALRHTFVSIIKSLPEGEVKPIVGHSKSMDTFGTYGHEIAGDREKAAQEINSIFKGLLKSVL